MRLVGTRPERLTAIPYRAAGPGGFPQTLQLSVDRLTVDELPAGCDALLVAGDLQGIMPSPLGGAPDLLGVGLADYLGVWADSGLLPAPDRIGVLLTGDLYSAPGADTRGASGAVADVWLAFVAAGCPTVCGVAGNHDEVTAAEVTASGPGAVLLDGGVHIFGGVTIAGMSGIIGDPRLPMRRTERDFLAVLSKLTAPPPDVLLLHEGPTGTRAEQLGRATIRTTLERRPPSLTFCGHVHWSDPVAALGDGHLVNVDARAVVLTR